MHSRAVSSGQFLFPVNATSTLKLRGLDYGTVVSQLTDLYA